MQSHESAEAPPATASIWRAWTAVMVQRWCSRSVVTQKVFLTQKPQETKSDGAEDGRATSVCAYHTSARPKQERRQSHDPLGESMSRQGQVQFTSS